MKVYLEVHFLPWGAPTIVVQPQKEFVIFLLKEDCVFSKIWKSKFKKKCYHFITVIVPSVCCKTVIFVFVYNFYIYLHKMLHTYAIFYWLVFPTLYSIFIVIFESIVFPWFNKWNLVCSESKIIFICTFIVYYYNY